MLAPTELAMARRSDEAFRASSMRSIERSSSFTLTFHHRPLTINRRSWPPIARTGLPAIMASSSPATDTPATTVAAPAPAPPVFKDDREKLLSDPVAYWDEGIWKKEEIPKFDMQCASPCLLQLIADGVVPPGRALVPGCGRGYDVTALASADREAIGLDLSPTGIAAARARLAALPDAEAPFREQCTFVEGDFFSFSFEAGQQKFTTILDYTFLCALPPERRGEWAARMKELLEPGNGLLITLIYPICDKPGGPPYAMSFALLQSLLEPLGFQAERLEGLPPEMSHKGRDGTGNYGATTGVGLWRLLRPEA